MTPPLFNAAAAVYKKEWYSRGLVPLQCRCQYPIQTCVKVEVGGGRDVGESGWRHILPNTHHHLDHHHVDNISADDSYDTWWQKRRC